MLENIKRRESGTVTAWAKWINKIEFEIAYIPGNLYQKLIAEQAKFKLNEDGTFDFSFKDEQEAQSLALKQAIRNWKNLTLGALQHIVEPNLVDIRIDNKKDFTKEIPFEEDMRDLIAESATPKFVDFVIRSASNIDKYIVSKKEKELKNSKRSVSTSAEQAE